MKTQTRFGRIDRGAEGTGCLSVSYGPNRGLRDIVWTKALNWAKWLVQR